MSYIYIYIKYFCKNTKIFIIIIWNLVLWKFINYTTIRDYWKQQTILKKKPPSQIESFSNVRKVISVAYSRVSTRTQRLAFREEAPDLRSSRVSREWIGGRNSIFSNGRFKEENAIFKVSCRRCLEEFSRRESGYSALICEVVRSIVRAAALESERRQLEKTKKTKGKEKKKEKEERSKSPFSDFFCASLKARARIDCAIKTRTGLKK